jgi:PmbA protein
MSELIRQAKGVADQAELFSTRIRTSNVQFSEGELELVAHRDVASCALRVLKKGRLGASYGDSVSQEGLLDRALEASSFGQEVGFGFANAQPDTSSIAANDSIGALTAEDLLDLCSQVVRRIGRAAPDAIVNMICQAKTGNRALQTTEGVRVEEGSSHAALHAEIPFPDRGTDTGAQSRLVSSAPLSIPRDWIEELLETWSWGANPSTPVSGRVPAILSPPASNLLTMVLNACLAGNAVANGVSPLANRIGEQIVSQELTIHEDARNGDFPFTRSFDDEGVACQSRLIIERGVLKGFLTDLSGAGALAQDSAGNAARRTMFSEKIDDAPMAGFLGAIISCGKAPWRDLMSDLEEGILVTQMSGLHSSNLLQGQYAVQALGYHIRNGRPVGYLKRTMMSGNVFEDFMNVRAISEEREPTAQEMLSVAGLAPYIVLDSVQVTVG